MLPEVERWFAANTVQNPRWTPAELLAAKNGRTVSVVLPALNEEATVGGVIAAVRPLTGGPTPLVDELIVLDSGSTDATIERALAAGARVVRREDVLPDLPVRPGKGEVLWRSLAAAGGDLLVFLDSDLVEVDPGFVPALLGPLLCTTGTHLVKGFYRRPLRIGAEDIGAQDVVHPDGGGRVTELLARPLLSALRPELSGVVQPLGGEYAATRELLESVPFAAGYGVELGLLLDTHRTRGLDALAQVNLGVRKHRNRSLRQLGVMSRQITGAVLARCGGHDAASGWSGFTQFDQVDGSWLPIDADVLVADRPPMAELRVSRVKHAG